MKHLNFILLLCESRQGYAPAAADWLISPQESLCQVLNGRGGCHSWKKNTKRQACGLDILRLDSGSYRKSEKIK